MALTTAGVPVENIIDWGVFGLPGGKPAIG